MEAYLFTHSTAPSLEILLEEVSCFNLFFLLLFLLVGDMLFFFYEWLFVCCSKVLQEVDTVGGFPEFSLILEFPERGMCEVIEGTAPFFVL